MAAEDKTTMGVPGDVSAARQVLSQTLRIRPDQLAAHYGLDDSTVDDVLIGAMAISRTRAEFVDSAHGALVRRKDGSIFERVEAAIRAKSLPRENPYLGRFEPTPTTAEATPVADQNQDLSALGREVSGLDAKVNILLGLAGTLLVGLIAGAIALWQAIGGVETRLTRELGQVETRIAQQIGDVRSEVGEIRGRLSATGQGPVPPR